MKTSQIRKVHGKESWLAESTDGLWTFERTEAQGTPWVCYRTGNTTPLIFAASLKRAEKYMTTGVLDLVWDQFVESQKG